jgi:hypothetical protein
MDGNGRRRRGRHEAQWAAQDQAEIGERGARARISGDVEKFFEDGREEAKPMVHVVESDKSVDAAARDIEASVQAHGFGVLHVYA